TDYIATVAAGGRLVVEQRAMSSAEQLEEALFTGLRLTSGVDLAAIQARYGVDVWARHGPDLQPFIDQGLLVYDRRLRLTRAGMLLAHEIMAVFIGSNVR